MSFDSTALVIPEDDERSKERYPVIAPLQGNSSNLIEAKPSTTASKYYGPDVRSRHSAVHSDSPPERDRFEVLDSWEGVVTVVEGDTFYASMRHANSKIERAEDEFEIYIDNVPQGDRDLVQVGGVFYLDVGIRRPRGEGPQKSTRIVFRRMPRWSSRDIEREEVAANELWEKLNAEPGTQATEPNSRTS